MEKGGSWLHPEKVSDAFRRICEAADLPPVHLRDLRHYAATVMHAGGGDLHYIKETLRHSTITLTSNTYTSLLPEVDREVAEAAALVVPRQAARTAGLTSGSHEGQASGEQAAAADTAKPSRTAKAQISGMDWEPRVGFEPTTCCLQDSCSGQLS
jgi:integrase-like protein